MKGLDLSKFKKVSHEEGHTILKHGDGHEIKILHTALSPKMQKELEAIPMAEGGKIEENPISKGFKQATGSEGVKQAEQNIKNSTQLPNQQQQPPAQQPSQSASAQYSEGGGVGAKTPGMYADGSDANTQPESSPMDTTPASIAPPPNQPDSQNLQPNVDTSNPQQDLKNFLVNDQNATQNDLMMGHIKPETYSDLYGKRDTLGKMGTLFGLMVGSMGSAVTHQPNIIMGMMDKEIERDLDAQKASASNAQNFYKMAQQNPLIQAQARQTGVQADKLAQAVAITNQVQATAHKFSQLIQSMPEGPQKEAAKQAGLLWYNKHADDISNMQDALALQASFFAGPNSEEKATPAGNTPSKGQGTTSEMPVSNEAPSASMKPILNKDADKIFRNKALDPTAQNDYGTLAVQYTKADQAQKALQNLNKNFDSMSNNTGILQHLESETAPLSGIAFGLGDILHGPLKSLAAHSDAGEKYYSGQTGLIGDLRAAFPDIGADEIAKMVNSNSPQNGDTPEILKQKKEQIEGFIRRNVPTTMLRKHRMLAN